MALSQNWSKDLAQMQDGKPQDLLKDVASMGLHLWQMYKQYDSAKGGGAAGFRTDEKENVGLAVGEVIAITGCRSDQTSADVGDVHGQFQLKPAGRGSRGSLLVSSRRSESGRAGGALTAVFIE